MSGLTLASTASMLSPSRALLAGLLVLVSTGLGSSCAASSSSADPSWSDGSSDEDVPDGPGGGAQDASPDNQPPAVGARYKGRVWGPHHDGSPPLFPISGAWVAAFAVEPDPLVQGAQCGECVSAPLGVPSTISGADGSFELELPLGKPLFLVVQKGNFRRTRALVTPGAAGDYTIDQELTTLPHRLAVGDHIPRIALVYGDHDHIGDVLAKAGLAKMDGAHGVDWGSGQLEFDVYDNSGPDQPQHGEPLSKLLDSADLLMSYDIVLFACSYNANFAFMSKPEIQQRLRDFVWAGGKLYASDYAMPVVEMPWSSFLWFDDPLHGGCAENKFPPNCNHGPPFDSPASVIDSGLSSWLAAQGLLAGLSTKENWNTIGGISVGVVGKDPKSGADITAPPKVWLEGPWTYSSSQIQSAGKDPKAWDASAHHPATVSWSHNCGRVLYTTYHTVGSTQGGKHPGLLPQEMVLFYLLMELTLCQDAPVVK
jgi:hypothetical protein